MKGLLVLFLIVAALAFAGLPVGSRVTYFATADGTPAPSFQWKKDGVLIPGATEATYVIPVLGPEHGGTYVAIATNSEGSAESPPDLLVVDPPPSATPKAPFNVRIGVVVTLAK
jgi:hypothetical protein